MKLKLLLLTLLAATSVATAQTTVTLEEEFRYNTDDARSVYEHTDLQLKYAATPWLDLFASYRMVFQEKSFGWDMTNVIVPGFTLKASPIPARYGALSLRSRAEITLEDSDSKAAYRETEWLKYNTPWKFTALKINPFIGDEVAFDMERSMRFNRNRVTVGVDWKITDHLLGDLVYYLQDDRSIAGKWSGTNLIVAHVKIPF